TVVLVASMGIGFWTGFVWQLIRIASVVACIWVASLYCPVVASILGTRLTESVRLIASFAAVFVAGLMVCYLLGYLVRDAVNALKPQMADRVLGAAFGLFNGALVVGLFAFLVLEFGAEGSAVRTHVEQSRAASLMATGLDHSLPDGLKRRIRTAGHLGREAAAGSDSALQAAEFIPARRAPTRLPSLPTGAVTL
ncbi:MAG: CvpA family protein, partial [Planctomycetota bacterium]